MCAVSSIFVRTRKGAGENFKEAAGSRLSDMAEAFRGLSKGFTRAEDEEQTVMNSDMVLEELWREICGDCENCMECWERNTETTYRYLLEKLDRGMNSTVSGSTESDFECVRKEQLETVLNTGRIMLRTRRNLSNRLAESREAVAQQLYETARILDEFSMEMRAGEEELEISRWLISGGLRTIGVRAKGIYMVKRKERGRELRLRVRSIRGRRTSSKDIAACVSRSTGCNMIPRHDTPRLVGSDYRTMHFVEAVSYQILSGAARVAREGENVSGDSFSFLYPKHGSMLMLLSDGMGSGREACRESTFVMDMLEKLLETGFSEEGAVSLLNSVLVTKNEQTILSTVDMASINLYTGICEFIKLGAATTYLKRGNRIESIGAGNLPLGAITSPEYKSCRYKLFDGDYIIMLSDGVTERFGERDERLQEIICSIEAKSPQDIADRIMHYVMEEKGHAADDMTVLVTGIWKA